MTTQATTQWTIDPAHSEIGFQVRHMMISTVRGTFTEFTGELHTNGDSFEGGSARIEIDVNSVHTNNKDRENHLKSDDFFNAEQYPKMTFVSKSFDGEKLVGDLTIRDITQEITLNVDYNGTVQDPYGQTKAGFEITGEINRKEFGLKWNAVTEAGAIVVSEKVKLAIHAQFVKQ